MHEQQLQTTIARARAILTKKSTEGSCPVPDKPWVRANLLWLLERAETSPDPVPAHRALGYVVACMNCLGWCNPGEFEHLFFPKDG